MIKTNAILKANLTLIFLLISSCTSY